MFIEALCKPRVLVDDVRASMYGFTILSSEKYFNITTIMVYWYVKLLKDVINILVISLSCASVRACCKSGHHLVGYDGNHFIFHKVLQLLCESSS